MAPVVYTQYLYRRGEGRLGIKLTVKKLVDVQTTTASEFFLVFSF